MVISAFRFVGFRPLSRILISMLVFVLVACGPNMTLMNERQEAAIGRKQHDKIVKEFGGVYQNEKVTAYVNSIMQRVARASDRPDIEYHITVLDSPVVNAFALPGGYTYVTRGLLALAQDEAEVAAVIGHEIGHVTARHAAQRHTAAVGASILAGVLAAVAGSQAPGNERLINDAVNLGGSALLAGYSRTQEYEADDIGVRVSAGAGYQPDAAARFLARLARESDFQSQDGKAKSAPLADWFSTHPNTAERVQRAREIAVPFMLDRGDYRLGRTAHLDAINGLAYGPEKELKTLSVVIVRKGDTINALAQGMAVADNHVARFRILNGLLPGDVLKAGERVKLIK